MGGMCPEGRLYMVPCGHVLWRRRMKGGYVEVGGSVQEGCARVQEGCG